MKFDEKEVLRRFRSQPWTPPLTYEQKRKYKATRTGAKDRLLCEAIRRNNIFK